MNGSLYGTTYAGGIFYGTVFAVNAAGVESVLYNFQGGADGWEPEASLTVLNSTLYGTTYWGGGSGCFNTGCGTIFEVSTSGKRACFTLSKAVPAAAATAMARTPRQV